MLIVRAETRKKYAAGDPRVQPVALAVVHWTASPPRHPGDANEARMRAWLADESRGSSTHFIVLRDGRVIQAADLDERTWHAGGSTWIDPSGRAVKSVNERSIGIDMECVGYLRRSPAGAFADGYGGAYHGAAPVVVNRQWLEPYTRQQSVAIVELARDLARQLPVLRDRVRWVGHCDVKAGKPDPGPHFPWEAVCAAVAEV